MLLAIPAGVVVSLLSPTCQLFAAEGESVALTWNAVRNARGYFVEIKDVQDRVVHQATVIGEHTKVVLKDGDYQVRITLINKFGKFSQPGDWEPYVVAHGGGGKAPKNRSSLSMPQAPSAGGGLFDPGAIWRAALLPGWGQSYQKRDGNAILIGGTFAFAALAGAALYPRYVHSKGAYESQAQIVGIAFAVSPAMGIGSMAALSESRHKLNVQARNLNVLAAGYLGLYAWNLADVTIAEVGRGGPRATVRARGEVMEIGFIICLR